MGVSFRTLLSGSSGNAALLDDGETRLLLDCGARSQRLCRAMLDAWARKPSAALVSHLHSDHINYASLRTLRDRGTPVYVHESLEQNLGERYLRGEDFGGLKVRTFGEASFRVGAFEVRALRVKHAPGYTTHGFAVAHHNGGAARRMVALTDLMDVHGLAEEVAAADLVYLEANHDAALLRQRPNPNSRFHLENSRAGALLCQALARRGRAPGMVVLGHLSDERNTRDLALRTVGDMLRRAGFHGVRLSVAPRFEPSEAFALG